MLRAVNILVTGCGGDIGQSIIKILKSLDFVKNVVGCDIHEKHPSIFLTAKFHKVPRVNEKDYIREIKTIVSTNDIQIIIPCSEPELRYHTRNRIYDEFINNKDLVVILPNNNVLEIGFDKLLTARFLEKNKFPYLETYDSLQINDPQFPCILKDRYGAGSKKIYIINDSVSWDYYVKRHDNLIYQEYIDDTEGEYTCGVYRFFEKTRVIIFRRILHGGYSGYGEVYRNEYLENIFSQMCENLDLNGGINIQFRLRNGVPYIFEINPRFSSTVLFRHLLGFQDVLWSIEAHLTGRISDYHPPSVGRKFYKGYSEYIN